MTGIAQIDISVAINFGLSICIASLSVWGYRRIKKVTPLYFGFAYALFAVSHYLLLTGGTTTPGLEFFLLRTGGYAFVMIGLFALLKDIIERQETEAELRSKKARLDATFDQAAVGIAEILPDLQIVQANRRFSSILGYGGPGCHRPVPPRPGCRERPRRNLPCGCRSTYRGTTRHIPGRPNACIKTAALFGQGYLSHR